MKMYLDKESSDYIEVKNDSKKSVDLSIKTNTEDKKSIILTAKLDGDVLDKLIANLILLKSRIPHVKE